MLLIMKIFVLLLRAARRHSGLAAWVDFQDRMQ